jgi:hypothetical protein
MFAIVTAIFFETVVSSLLPGVLLKDFSIKICPPGFSVDDNTSQLTLKSFAVVFLIFLIVY